MTKAILIGAGFSCDLGMPLGIDVTNKFFRKLNSEELLKFKAIYDNARPYDKNRKMSEDAFQDILHIFEQYQYKENYEKFIQRIELLGKGSGDRSYIDGIRYFLGIIYEWLYGYFLEVQEKSFNLYQDMKSTYAWFEKFIDKNHETWVLSLNHDLLIEFLSKDYNIPLSMGLNKKKEFLLSNYENDKKVKFIELDRDYYDINKMNFFRNKKGINLIKLHGGLNEFSYKDNKIKNEESGQILCFADYMTDLTSLSYLDHIITINKKMKNYINGQDVKAGKELAITGINGDLEYLRASGSMPFVSNLVEINGNKYLDGALADPIPLKKALSFGYEKIIVVLTRPADYTKTKSWLPFDLVYKKYPEFVKIAKDAYINYNETLDLIRKYEKEGKIIVLRPSKKIKMRRIEKNLNKLQAIYDVGVKDCNNNLSRIKGYIYE